MKLSPEVIVEEARRLRFDLFQDRLRDIETRGDERFNKTVVKVPEAYQKTAYEPKSNILNDEGRQVATLVYAPPIPHMTPPTPEDQRLTTKCERFLTAMFRELEDRNGPVNWQCTLAQTHDNLGWIFSSRKKAPYKGQPRAPRDGAGFEDLVEYDMQNSSYKKEQGIGAVFEYEHAVTGTVLYKGPVFNPHCIYVWKEVPEIELMSSFGVYKKADGTFTKGDPEQSPGRGYPEDARRPNSRTVTVVEYWDHEDCVIVTQSIESKWFGFRKEQDTFELTSWQHNFGRVPFFARPAFVTEQLDEDKKYEGPLDGIHAEIGQHKRLTKMVDSVSYMTAFAPLKVITKEQGETIVDDTGQMIEFVELVPGKAKQLAPGQDIAPVGQSPEVANLYQQLGASTATLQHYMLSQVTKGQSPGADTANAALTNLHQFQLSTLDPMAQQESRQWSALFRFWLEQIRELGETVYVLDKEGEKWLSLSPEDIPTVFVDAKTVPDQGQQQLLIEKHAAEMYAARVITLTQMYEMWGKENPEEFAEAVRAEQVFDQLWPVFAHQIVSDFGMLDALKQMTEAREQTGDARNAVPQIMEQAAGLNAGVESPTGMGQGAGGQPRQAGVRMPTEAVNTQEAMTNGGY